MQGQLERLRELYIVGDVEKAAYTKGCPYKRLPIQKAAYTYRRAILQRELDGLEPPVVADVTQAAAALTNFALFWEREPDPAERNTLLRLIFESVSLDKRGLCR